MCKEIFDRRIQDNWWKTKSEEIEAAANVKNSKLLFTLLREMYGTSCPISTYVKNRNGVLLGGIRRYLKAMGRTSE